MTGWGRDLDRQQSHQAGFDHHLTKPIEPSELERLLNTCRSTADRVVPAERD
jgi:CheY-like chemotaxis protein